jgi:hypothetical protein
MPTEKNAAFLPMQYVFKLDRQRVKQFNRRGIVEKTQVTWITTGIRRGCSAHKAIMSE